MEMYDDNAVGCTYDDFGSDVDTDDLFAPWDDLNDSVGDWREGETLADRNARLLAKHAAAREEDRPHGTRSDPAPQERTANAPVRRGKMKSRPSALVSVDAAGDREYVNLGGDVPAIMAFLASTVGDGDALAELIAPTPRGRLTESEAARRDQLAQHVAAARERGATLKAIAAGIGRPVSRVHALAERGRALSGAAI